MSSFRTKLARLKKNSLFSSSMTSNTFLYEIRTNSTNYNTNSSNLKSSLKKNNKQTSNTNKNNYITVNRPLLTNSSLHLSMPKLNFDVQQVARTRSDSNLFGRFCAWRRAASSPRISFVAVQNNSSNHINNNYNSPNAQLVNQKFKMVFEDSRNNNCSNAQQQQVNKQNQKFKILFEHNNNNNNNSNIGRTTRSNSCLVENSSSFEASRLRLIRTRQIQAALENIESEMDKLLASTRGKIKRIKRFTLV